MSQKTFIEVGDDEGTASVAGGNSPVVSLRSRRRDPVILVFSQRPAARCVLADETSPIEGFEHIGEVSVRLLAEWSKPRMRLLAPPQGGGKGGASA